MFWCPKSCSTLHYTSKYIYTQHDTFGIKEHDAIEGFIDLLEVWMSAVLYKCQENINDSHFSPI